jgi:hypothetical protein
MNWIAAVWIVVSGAGVLAALALWCGIGDVLAWTIGLGLMLSWIFRKRAS